VLTQRADELKADAKEYADLRLSPVISKSSGNRYILDLLGDKGMLSKSYIGLVVGTFLTIRAKKTGKILACPICHVAARQEHFLNVCPSNTSPRAILSRSLPPTFVNSYLQSGDFFSFYRDVRCLEILVTTPLDSNDPISSEIYRNLAGAASSMADAFVKNALDLFTSGTVVGGKSLN